MANNKNAKLKKGKSSFSLVGKAKINDFTFDIDKVSDSKWQYSTLNLGVDCGSCGTIYAEMMGGFSQINDNLCYVHGKKENESGNMIDDFSNQFTLDWEDRLDDKYLEDVGEMSFIKVSLEKDVKGNTFTKSFLSEYDAIEYIQEHLTDGMVIRVNGNISYQPYNGTIYAKKNITSIYASKVEEDDFKATFQQTLLTPYDITDAKKDKNSGNYLIRTYVIDYVGKYSGRQVKETFTFPKTFELEIKNEDKKDMIFKKMLKPKKKTLIAEVSMEGIITKGSNETDISLDDVPEDIKELIELGIYTEEEAMQKCVGNKRGSSESYVLQRPTVKLVKSGDVTNKVLEVFLEKYNLEDLNMFDFEAFGEVAQTDDSSEEEGSGVDIDDLDDLFGDDDDEDGLF